VYLQIFGGMVAAGPPVRELDRCQRSGEVVGINHKPELSIVVGPCVNSSLRCISAFVQC
jgi:hypothetical protein